VQDAYLRAIRHIPNHYLDPETSLLQKDQHLPIALGSP
jgi:hypothetical protein